MDQKTSVTRLELNWPYWSGAETQIEEGSQTLFPSLPTLCVSQGLPNQTFLLIVKVNSHHDSNRLDTICSPWYLLQIPANIISDMKSFDVRVSLYPLSMTKGQMLKENSD